MADDAPSEPVSTPVIVAPPPRLLSWLARRPYAALALFCLILWLPGILSLPALDRDESRFAESSRQMLDSGNYVDIRFGQVPRYKKPVGIYWAQAATTALAGHVYGVDGDNSHIWTYRLPSLAGGVVAVWLTFWCGSLFGAETGLLAALLLASTMLLAAEATMATTDAMLLATIMVLQGILFRIYQGPVSTRLALTGWAVLALGILVKGPVAPGVAAATVIALLAWDRWKPGAEAADWRWLKHARPLLGVPLLLVIVAPWLIAITLQSHGAFFQQSLGDDFAAKVAGGQEGHGAPPGYYLLTAMVTFWPAILFILPGLGLGIARRSEAPIRFLLAWAGAWWLVVELVPTKLWNYALPAYPALAILAALWLLAPAETEGGWRRWLPRIAMVQFLLALAALAAAPVLLAHFYGSGEVWWQMVGAAAIAVAGVTALGLFLSGRKLAALLPSLLAVGILLPLLMAGVGPLLTRLWVTEALAGKVARTRRDNDPPPVLAGYTEPSLVFALGADVGLTDGRGAAEWGANKGGLALVDDDERPQFLAHLAELQADATALDDVTGFNYSRGRAEHVTLYRVTGLMSPPASLPAVLPSPQHP